jgi:hypothetical protein
MLDALRMMRTQNMQQPAARTATPAPATQPRFGEIQAAPAPQQDLFKRNAPSVEPKPILEKSAPSGGLGGLFQTLKSNLLPSITPAPVDKSTQVQAANAQVNDATKRVAATNPFAREAILLDKNVVFAGLQTPAMKTQSLNGTKPEQKPKPIGGLSAIALPFAGVGLLAAPVLAPAALVVKPALVNPFLSQLPILIP